MGLYVKEKKMKPHLPVLTSLCLILLATVACSLSGTDATVIPESSPTLPESTATQATQPTEAVQPTEQTSTQAARVLVDSPQLMSMRFITEADGWGVTSQYILRTDDGGTTWFDVTPAGVTDFGYGPVSYFLDAEHGWVAILNPSDPTEPGQLYRTSDGGASWEEFSFSSGMGGYFDFIDPANGFYMEDLGAGAGSNWVAIHATTDGGANWTTRFTHEPGAPEGEGDLPGSGMKSGMTFLDTNHGWITGSIPMDNYLYLYATTDGGTTWNLQPGSVPTDFGTVFAGTYPPVFFGQNGIMPVTLIGNVINLVIYTSDDGGASWTASPAPVANAGRGELADFVSPTDGFVWAQGRFAVTHDGAQSWETVTPSVPFGDNFLSMDFVDTSTGWVLTMNVDSHYSLYQTTDGGVNWITQVP
jgi:photosystem II stability/assembly factor-like uncharacterized protein